MSVRPAISLFDIVDQLHPNHPARREFEEMRGVATRVVVQLQPEDTPVVADALLQKIRSTTDPGPGERARLEYLFELFNGATP